MFTIFNAFTTNINIYKEFKLSKHDFKTAPEEIFLLLTKNMMELVNKNLFNDTKLIKDNQRLHIQAYVT